MSSQKRSSKSRSLKRKVQSDLKELIRNEKVRCIVQGASCSTAYLPSSLDESMSFTLPAALLTNDDSHSSAELISETLPSNSLEDNLIEFTQISSDHELPVNEQEKDGDSEDNFTDDLYFLTSNSECSSSENEAPLAIGNDKIKCDENSLKPKLIKWALRYKIKHNALSHLLKILQKEKHPELPADSRTLLKTTRKSELASNNDGSETCYFGLVKGLLCQDLKKLCKTTLVQLKINIDGLPICKSTGGQFWPILCQIVSDHQASPFLVACYHGNTKPKSIEDFLDPFVQELITLQTHGFDYHGTLYRISIHNVICDAPARAFIKCIKGHGGYHGCEKCSQKGLYVNRRMLFLDSEAEKRTDNSFKLQVHKKHHVGVSPLLKLNLGLVTQVPLDYMHLVILGAMRKLLMYWIRNGERNVRISAAQVSNISSKLLSLAKNTPSEFSRKPRSLRDIDRFKATELRQILLYTGPIVLRGVISEEAYRHFLLLHVAISTLTSEIKSCNEQNINYAEELLKLFVQEMEKIYKNESVVYNIHNLVHLPDDVRRFGCLDNFSCFPFENFLFELKNTLRTSNRPLSQLCRRISENGMTRNIEVAPLVKLSKPHNGGPCLELSGGQFGEVVLNGSKISALYENDSFVQMHDNKIVKVLNVIKTPASEGIDGIYIICNPYHNHGDFYSYPCSSQRQSIYKIGNPTNTFKCYRLKSVTNKCLVSTDMKVAVALIHRIF